MAEVEIVKVQQKQVWAKSFWDSRKFAELMAYSSMDAAQYCIDCWIETEINGMDVKDIVAWKKKIEEVEEVEVADNTTDKVLEENLPEYTTTLTKDTEIDEEIPSLTKEDLQELLKANSIAFKNTFWQKKLLEIAQDNKLL